MSEGAVASPKKPRAPKKPRREILLAQYNAKFVRHTEIVAELAAIEAELKALDAHQNILEGTAVFITIGKGEKARTVEGVVAGVRLEADGSKSFKVTYGSGFDAEVAVVRGSQIKLPTAENPASV